MKLKVTASSYGLARTINDATGVNGARFDVRLCCNVKETANALGISPTTVYRLTARGVLKPSRHCRHLAFPVAQLISLTGGDGTVINVPAKVRGDRKNKKSKPAPTTPGPLEHDPRWPFLPGLSPDEVLATQEKQKGGFA